MTEQHDDGADERVLAAWPKPLQATVPADASPAVQKAIVRFNARRREVELTPLELFEWAVVRQSDLGPGVATAASAFGVTPARVRELVRDWADPRGHMECERIGPETFASWRIEAYYNTSGG